MVKMIEIMRPSGRPDYGTFEDGYFVVGVLQSTSGLIGVHHTTSDPAMVEPASLTGTFVLSVDGARQLVRELQTWIADKEREDN